LILGLEPDILLLFSGSVHNGWLSVIKDQSVVDTLHAVGREIAFIPSWFARIESRKQEFSGVVQGDFHVSEFSSAVLSILSPRYFDFSDEFYVVERWMANG
jgi:hypothetical protein